MRLKHFACLLALLAAVGCSPVNLTIGGDPSDNALRATVVDDAGGFDNDSVAVIDVSGLIHNGRSGLFGGGENPVALLDEQLRRAADDSDVKAVILRINSPGGTVTASDVMYRQVMRFKEKTGKPVIALMMDVAASGGYYLACAADAVVAYPTTVTASIGVIVQTISFKGAMTRVGINAEALTSGPNKAAGSPLGDLTPEHRAVLQKMVDDFYKRFVEKVRKHRPSIPPDQFAAMTDGRIVSGDKALSAGLVDHLGDLHDAFRLAKSAAGIDKADLIRYHRKHRYVGSPYANAPSPIASAPGASGHVPPGGVQVNLLQLNVPETFAGSSVGFYYLWLPAGR